MQITVLYLATALLFLVLDFAGLSLIIKPTFEKSIGALLLDTPRYGPALVFYLFYVAGLLFFVSVPALRADTGLGTVFLHGAVLGAIGYGTYEFSNLATLKDWTWTMVATDLVWGTLLTGVIAAGGVAVARAVG